MIFQAIVTKYIGPTNTRPGRIAAARAVADKYRWPGYWLGGGMPNGKGNVYVCAPCRDAGTSISYNAAFHTDGEV